MPYADPAKERAYNAAHHVLQYRRRTAAGLCVKCGRRKAEGDCVRCGPCLVRHRRHGWRRYWKRKGDEDDEDP